MRQCSDIGMGFAKMAKGLIIQRADCVEGAVVNVPADDDRLLDITVIHVFQLNFKEIAICLIVLFCFAYNRITDDKG